MAWPTNPVEDDGLMTSHAWGDGVGGGDPEPGIPTTGQAWPTGTD